VGFPDTPAGHVDRDRRIDGPESQTNQEKGTLMRHLPLVLLVVAALLSQPAIASAQEKPYLIHAGVGFAKALNDGAPGGSVGLEAGMIYRIPSSPRVGIGAEIGYLMLGSATNTLYDALGNYYTQTAKWSSIPVMAQLYFFPQLKGPTPVLTAGLGLYPIKLNYSEEAAIGAAYGQYATDVTTTDLGLNFGGGFLFGTSRSPMRFGLDARFHLIMTDVESTNLITAMGRIYF
jgi:hypothetical protein